MQGGTHTLHGPAVPRTSRPSDVRITTHTFDPPPSAQRTREEDKSVASIRGDVISRRFVAFGFPKCPPDGRWSKSISNVYSEIFDDGRVGLVVLYT